MLGLFYALILVTDPPDRLTRSEQILRNPVPLLDVRTLN